MVDIAELESYNKVEANKELINKEAKKAKFRLLGPLGKVYNIVVYIYGSGSYTAYFRKLAGRIIPINNYIRWNSWYNILQVLLKEKAHINKYYKYFKYKL